MVWINYRELLSHWEKGKFLPVYYFHGEENFFIEETIKKFLETVSILDFDIFYGTELSINELESTILTTPFVSQKRVIIIKESEKIKKQYSSRLCSMFNTYNIPNYVIFIHNGKLLRNKADDLVTAIAIKGAIVEFNLLDEKQILNWVIEEAKKYRKIIPKDTAQYLYQLYGNNLFDLRNELDKLVLFTDKDTITIEDVETCAGYLQEYNISTLINAIITKNAYLSAKILDILLQRGEEPIRILNIIYYTFRKLLALKTIILEKKIYNTEVLCKEVALPKYTIRYYLDNLPKFDLTNIINVIEQILKTDLALKTMQDDKVNLEKLILEITH